MSGTKDLTEGNGGAGKQGPRWPLFVGLPLIVLVAVAAVVFSGGQTSRSGGEQGATGVSGELGSPSLGSEDAPVVMIEYGDFQ